MELLKLFTLLCCTAAVGFASHNDHPTHVIPVEGYDTELQNLGEHVEYPETPVKVVKITKTIAVKVPVPYPVKVVEKVPYPVHVNKPYPVPVPQIIKVPVAQHPHGHEALDVGHGNFQSGGYGNFQGGSQGNFNGDSQGNFQEIDHGHFQDRQYNVNPYQVQENPNGAQEESHGNQSYDEGNHGNSNSGTNVGEYSAAGSSGYQSQQPQDFHGSAGDLDGHYSFESKSYDLAIQNYLNNLKPKEHHAGDHVY